MANGFQPEINRLIQTRLDEIFTGEEFALHLENLYKDLDERLLSITEPLDEEKRHELIEDVKANIYDQIFFQLRITYRTAFIDSFRFFGSSFIVTE